MNDLDKITSQFIVNGTIDEPFLFFEDLIFYDSFEKVLKSFYTQTNITKDYRFIEERDEYFHHEAWHRNNDLSDIIDYNKHFVKVLNFSSNIAMKCLDNKLKITSDSDKKPFISSQLNFLVSCLDKNKTFIKDKPHDFVEQEIFNIISDIRIKYQYIISIHKAFTRASLNSDVLNSVFQPKPKLKRQFFIDLYNLAVDMDIIDDVEITEDIFMDIFTSRTPQKDNKIVFIKPNPIVAYFLKEIEPFFNNFSSVAIEKSQYFINKQNKVINSADLYTALSRGKDKNMDYLNTISSSIASLKSLHLD